MILNFYIEKTILYLYIIKYNNLDLISDIYVFNNIFKKIYYKRKIKLKFGIDPTFKIIHLGHINVINKIIQLKKLEFKIIIIIGNFTSFIGDPTYNNKSRVCNKNTQISLNTYYFLCQLKLILNFNNIYIYYNIEWLNLFSNFDLINLLYILNLNKILQREDFKLRCINDKSIFIPELFYLFFQTFDSLFIKSDIEIGGKDQKLNFLITRDLQKKVNNFPQVLLLIPLLIGLDGKYKMSKSRFNFLSFDKGLIYFYKILYYLKIERFYYYYLSVSFFKNKYNLFNLNKVNLLFELASNFFIKNIVKIFCKSINNLLISKFNKNLLYFYKIFKNLKFDLSYNSVIYNVKNKTIKINNILLNNFNFILLKGKYFIKIDKNNYIFIFC